MNLLEILINNSISPAYDEVFLDLGLTFFYLVMTIVIECGAFYFYFRKKETQTIADHVGLIFVMNVVTFMIGAILYILIEAWKVGLY